ncbi:MAG: FAD-dependent oxidoreductase [Eubacterium ramulus]
MAVIGAGPAGLFAAYLLAQRGYCPHIYEARQSSGRTTAGCGRFLERGCTGSGVKCAVWRRWCRYLFRWKAEYTGER